MQRSILLVDDDNQLLRILALQLRLSGEWRIVGSATQAADILPLALSLQPDVVLIDLWLYGHDTLEQIAQLVALSPPPLVVVLSAEEAPIWQERARSAGAKAFLSKLEQTDLPAALRDL